MFVIPILMVYEIGVLALEGEVVRNGVELWLRGLFAKIGMGQYFILPIVVVGAMFVWHRIRQDRWNFPALIIFWMIVESIVLASILFCAAKAHQLCFDDSMARFAVSQPHTLFSMPNWPTVVGFLGSGVYEEFLFRLMLLPAGIVVASRITGSRRVATILAMVLVSLLFSLIHYQILNPVGEPFEWAGFVFRFSAGVLFSLLFLHRGFGIAVGTHAAYNLLTQL